MESRGRELIEMAAGMQAPAKTSREGGVLMLSMDNREGSRRRCGASL